MQDIRPGRWRHYKGKDYEVLFTARHSETEEPMVVYRALYGGGGVWVRPAGMWHETVAHQGAGMRRFTYTGDMDITLRRTLPPEYRETENLTREAFWNLMGPGCDEHYLLHEMRADPAFIPELDFVAAHKGKILGNIIYTKSRVVNGNGQALDTITFGPVAVLPEYQGRGIGALMIFHTLDLAREMGYQAVIILGHPDYYPRFGFRRARDFGLATAAGETFDPFMALELAPGSLSGGGVYHYARVYNVDPEKAAAFDKTFPYKEKKIAENPI